jgi:isochorismate pyruvate lyase
MKAPEKCTTIEEVRDAIDQIDDQIVSALGLRFRYVKAVTRFKKTNADVAAPVRFQQVLSSRRAWAEQAGLNPDVVEQMYRLLIAHFIEEERKLLHLNQQDA